MVLLAALFLSGAWQRSPAAAITSRRAAAATLGVVGASRLVRRRAHVLASEQSQQPRLLLTSAGLTTPKLEASFHRMLHASSMAQPPRIAMLVTAQMAPSGLPSKRSSGELRRRRWADACKKGREIEAQLGVPVECVDCAREDKPAAEYEDALRAADCIWVTGGNTFFLWHHMRRAGVDKLVKRRVASGCLYVGQSAGAIVAGTTIRTAFWKGWDDPAAAGPAVDWSDEANLRGMGLTAESCAFFPHYDEAWAQLVRERSGEVDGRLVCLTDDGATALVSGDDEQIETDGVETSTGAS